MVVDSSLLVRCRSSRGNIYVLQGVALICPKMGCSIAINITNELTLKSNVEIVVGSVYIVAGNANLLGGSVINVTERAGDLPQPTTGTMLRVVVEATTEGGRAA
ncbi:hypothetical protein C2S52_022546 [Perilla frutescens var. hirtella]|nr:hypothetical protein C2S52_022546 [Perilla frutescens var. hirtella]KAH6807081.1 hypothetical protein C2S51_028189 [Perilla frutescens var. frutescens]